MSTRVLPHASDLRRSSAREAPPLAAGSSRRRRIRDDARDGLTAAAVSLGGSLAVTCALAVLLRWLG